MKKNNILIFTAFHQRPQISQLYWYGIERLKKNFNIKVLSIISDDSNKTLAEKYSDFIIETETKPLGKKLNSGLKKVLELDFDFMVQLGSDNLMTDRLMSVYQFYFNSGCQLFGAANTILFDSISKQAQTFDFGNVWSGVNKTLLEKVCNTNKIQMLQSVAGASFSYPKGAFVNLPESIGESYVKNGLAKFIKPEQKLWDDEKMQGLDRNSEVKFEGIGITNFPVVTEDPEIICVKSNENIWKYDFYNGSEYENEKLKEKISEKEFQYLTNL